MRAGWVRAATAGAALAALAALASGCSTSAETPLATLSPTTGPAATTSASPTTTEGAATTTTAPSGPVSPLSAKVGYRPATLSPDQQAVVAAYDAYWVFRAQSLGTNTVDLSMAGTVATAQGIGQITAYVSQQKAKGLHAAGVVTTNVLGVSIAAEVATLDDCALNDSYDVKTDTGAPASKPTGLKPVKVSLTKGGSGWLVANINPGSGTCTVPAA